VFDTYHLEKPVQPGEWLGNVFANNVFFHARGGEPNMVLYNHRGEAVTWSVPKIQAVYPQTFFGNIEAEPQFANTATGDFRLQATSPAGAKEAGALRPQERCPMTFSPRFAPLALSPHTCWAASCATRSRWMRSRDNLLETCRMRNISLRWPLAALCWLSLLSPSLADDWPQWLGPNRDSVWRETGIVKRFPREGLPVKWRSPVSLGYSGPAVASGRVFLMDYVVRAGQVTNNADGRDRLDGSERVLCLDADSGQVLWKHEDRFFLFNESGDLLLARLTPQGYQEISRFHVLEPTGRSFGRPVVWSHPAFARRCLFARNDKEIVCLDLKAFE
jgi:hypothetical protein